MFAVYLLVFAFCFYVSWDSILSNQEPIVAFLAIMDITQLT